MILLESLNPKQDMIRFPQERSSICFKKYSEFYPDLSLLTRNFSSYALHELPSTHLMSRFDTKYLLNIYLLPEILVHLQPHYAILDINHHRIFTYQNVYFDTENFQFYTMHHNGKLNRFKVRHRKYVETQTDFLEVKFKNSRHKTTKTRIKINPDREATDEIIDFLRQQLSGNITHLYPKQWVRYQRISLVHTHLKERVTLDFCLCFQPIDGEFSYTLDGLLIAELKQERKNVTSPFFELMRQHHLRPMSFSKYCVGCCLTHFDQLKINNFKPKLVRLQQHSVIRKDYCHAA